MNRNTEPPIPFARPSIGAEEEEAVLSVLRSGWLTTGSQALSFETEFAEYTGAGNALAVSSATAGLHLSLEALGIQPGDTVVTTPYTFTATAEVVRYLGAEVVFADIEEQGFNIDPDAVERAFASGDKSHPRALLPVHIAGAPCNMDALLDIAHTYNAFVVEDAAHAFPVTTNSRYVGTLGDAGVYSFYANKTITTGEGGMVVTGRDDVARRVAVMRNHGIDRDAWDRYTKTGASWKYAVVAPGYKYNMPDIAAAVGRVQLAKAQTFLNRRIERANQYLSLLSPLEYLRMPPHSGPSAWHLFIIGLNVDRLKISRDDLMRRLSELGIGTSMHYIPLHLMPYYRDRYGLRRDQFPNAVRRYETSVSLPLYPDMNEEQVSRVCSAIRDICDDAYVPRKR